MKKARIASLGAALLATLMLAPAGAGAQAAGTGVDDLDATKAGNFIQISGNATFVDSVVEVGFDGTGDALQPNVGADVNRFTVNRPVGSNNLIFTVEVADMPGGQTVPGIVYTWPLMVDGNDTGLFLMGSRVGGIGPCPAQSFCASLMQDGADGFSTVARLSGATGADGKVVFPLPVFRLGVGNTESGAMLSMGGGGPMGSINGANEIVYCCAAVDDGFAEDTVIPAASVMLGIAEAGTPAHLVPLTTAANVGSPSGGGFTAAMPAPPSGDYVVVAKACYAANDCGLSSTEITV